MEARICGSVGHEAGNGDGSLGLALSGGDKHSEELMSLIEGLRGEIEVMRAQLAGFPSRGGSGRGGRARHGGRGGRGRGLAVLGRAAPPAVSSHALSIRVVQHLTCCQLVLGCVPIRASALLWASRILRRPVGLPSPSPKNPYCPPARVCKLMGLCLWISLTLLG